MKTYKLNFAQFLVNFPIVNSFANSNNLILMTLSSFSMLSWVNAPNGSSGSKKSLITIAS